MNKATPIRPDVTPLSLPPHNLDAERSVIGGLMLDHTAWDRIVDLVGESDFYAKDHRLIFAAIAKICESGGQADVVTVSDRLGRAGHLDEIGGLSELAKMAQEAVTAAAIDAHAKIVRNYSLLRAVKAAAARMDELTRTGTDPMQILDKAQSYLSEIAETGANRHGPVSLAEMLPDYIDRLDQRHNAGGGILGIPTGFPDLDELTDGLCEGALWIVAARPSMGKSLLAMQMALHVAFYEKKPILFVTQEMTKKQVMDRVVSNLGRINADAVRRGNMDDGQWQSFAVAMTKIKEAASLFQIDGASGLKISELRARARALARRPEGLNLIVVDYLQMMKGEGENRTQEVSFVCRGLKSIATELNVPLIAISSLNRSLEQRNDKRPIMSDLRDSGNIEFDADVVLAIYRDEVYNPETLDKGLAELLIRKCRDGKLGRVGAKFEGDLSAFRSLTEGLPSWNLPPEEERQNYGKKNYRRFD